MGADARTVIFPMMRPPHLGSCARISPRCGGLTRRLVDGSWRELGRARRADPDTTRWRQCLMAAWSCRSPSRWRWRCSSIRSGGPASAASCRCWPPARPRCSRGMLRIGARWQEWLSAFIMARWLPYDQFALALFLALTTLLGTVGMSRQPAWHWPGCCAPITVNMVLLMGLIIREPCRRRLQPAARSGGRRRVASALVDQPARAQRCGTPTATAAPGWRHLLDATGRSSCTACARPSLS